MKDSDRKAMVCWLPICWLLVWAMIGVGPAHADIQNCNGTWTNQSCEMPSAPGDNQVITEKPESTLSPEETLAEDKRKLVRDTNSRVEHLRRNFGVNLDLTSIERYCKDPDTSLANCKSRLFEIDQRVIQAQLELESARAKSIAQEPVTNPNSGNQINDNSSNTTIVEQTDYQQNLAVGRNPRQIITNDGIKDRDSFYNRPRDYYGIPSTGLPKQSKREAAATIHYPTATTK